MANFNEQYENLPGVKVDYQDGNLYTGAAMQSTRTKSILLIGSAIDGPVGEPISVNAIGGPKAAEKLFGGMLERVKIEENGVEKTIKRPHQGSLIRSMYEAINAGNEDIRLLRVEGKTAKTELPAKDPNSEVLQPLADLSGNNLMPGNIAFSKALELASDQRLVNIEKVDEFKGTDVTVDPYRTFTGSTGYVNVDDTPGSETVYFGKDVYSAKNTLRITLKAKKRNYTEVSRSEDGVTDTTSTKGLLTQDPTMTNYFAAEVGNWSDDPIHQVNVYIKDSSGNVDAIGSVNASGERLWRIGKEDATVSNELVDPITAQEFQQGGIRFTEAYQQEVAAGTYPALTGVTVTVDYFYYNDIEMQVTKDVLAPGSEKETFLNFMPESDSLQVYYEVSGVKTTLEGGVGYTMIYPSTPEEKTRVMIQSGAGPVGAKLFAHYKTGENAIQGAKLIVNAKSAGKIYGGIEDITDFESLYGVKVVVEYEKNENGTLDMDNRIIRFIKPADKKLTSSDVELRFRTKELRGIRTIREFANYVNGLPNNNIVHLEVPLQAGDVPFNGLLVTDYSVSPIDGRYDYRPINLGEKYDENTMMFSLYVDDSKAENDMNRFPWLGTDGFFDPTSLQDTKNFYESLGGKYALVEGTADEFELTEQGIYSKLENYSVDIIDLLDVHANTPIGGIAEDGSLIVDPMKNFATQLAQHCAMVTAKTHETIGVIGVVPAPQANLRDVQEYIDLVTKGVGVTEEKAADLLRKGISPSFRNDHFMYNLATHDLVYNDEGDAIDIGKYVNVVFGPEVGLGNDRLGTYITNGSTVYSGLISVLNVEDSTTNKPVAVAGLRYKLSESQHNQLAGGRFVTFESKISQNGNAAVVVKDGVTAAQPNSDFTRLSTVNITHGTVQLIRQKSDKFIGLPNGIAQRNSLATEIQAALDSLKEKGVLNNFKFSIYTSAKDRVLGNAFITLELVPAYELRKIFTSVALRASL